MDTPTPTEPEPQQQRETGWREHPDFQSLSDAELIAEEAIMHHYEHWQAIVQAIGHSSP